MKKTLILALLSILLTNCGTTLGGIIDPTDLGGRERAYTGKYYIKLKGQDFKKSIDNLNSAIINSGFKPFEQTDNYSKREAEKEGTYLNMYNNGLVQAGDLVGLSKKYVITSLYNKQLNKSEIELKIECMTTRYNSGQKYVEDAYQKIISEYNRL